MVKCKYTNWKAKWDILCVGNSYVCPICHVCKIIKFELPNVLDLNHWPWKWRSSTWMKIGSRKYLVIHFMKDMLTNIWPADKHRCYAVGTVFDCTKVSASAVLQGNDVKPEHCTIENNGGDVSLIPFGNAPCTVNGLAVDEPVVLSQGITTLFTRVGMTQTYPLYIAIQLHDKP